MHTDSQALSVLQEHIQNMPTQMAILGSGWKNALIEAKIDTEISFSEWLGVDATVPGHEGKLIIATIGKQRVAVMSGRIHTYEGYSSRQATMPIRVLQQAGVQELVVTAACGGLNPKYKVGDFVLLNDVLTLFLALDNPLIGPDFIDVSEVFDADLRQRAREIMVEQGIPFQQGVYCYYHGPNYETPADKMALRFLGADVVGMSTVPEVLMARSLSMNVLGVAFVTNLAFVKHDHREVVAQAEAASQQMVRFLTSFYS